MLINEEWIGHFPDALVRLLPYSLSDHYTLLLDIGFSKGKENRCDFIFENWWTMVDLFEAEVRSLWSNGTGSVLIKLERL